jgi:hypothetical protein
MNRQRNASLLIMILMSTKYYALKHICYVVTCSHLLCKSRSPAVSVKTTIDVYTYMYMYVPLPILQAARLMEVKALFKEVDTRQVCFGLLRSVLVVCVIMY